VTRFAFQREKYDKFFQTENTKKNRKRLLALKIAGSQSHHSKGI
jgi:hypothetical protein